MDNLAIDTLNKVLDGCKIDAICVNANQYRHFSFYDLMLRPGCKISRINHFIREIALAMRTKTVPIIKTLPDKGIVRLQTTHAQPDIIDLPQLYLEEERPKGVLPFLFGETDEGNKLWIEMTKNPHLLVAGTTGSGKSVFFHNLIYNAIQFEDLDLYLVDTKKVEFGLYQGLPKVINLATDYEDAVSILENLCQIMEQRYQYMSDIGLSNFEQNLNLFNKILLIIDEAADLMLLDKSGHFEKYLIKLAAKSRAAGIFIVLGTQRPSVDVITGLIKANFPARLACKVSSKHDSQIIMDYSGAENLLGKGDALFKNPTMDSVRLQIAHVNLQTNLEKLNARYN